MISNDQLVNGKKYIIYHKNEDKLTSFSKGIFRGLHIINQKLIFIDVIKRVREDLPSGRFALSLYNYDIVLYENDIYIHDIEKVKENAIHAIQCMEQRALDKVLKRLVNEQFEW